MAIKYDKIGVDYNLTRKADPYLTERLFHHLRPTPDGTYLDIGCGTGNYTHEFAKKGFDFIGVDPSRSMLEKAKLKNPSVLWKLGSAENIGLPKSSVDGIIGFLTLHHWANLEMGFSELYKVLKAGGRFVFFTATPRQMKGYWLNHYFPKMLSDSIIQMPTLEKIKTIMSVCGFVSPQTHKYAVQPDLEDQFLYCGKLNPKLYFDPKIRKGISSFSSLSTRKEVREGLLELQRDVNSGKIKNVMKTYENDLGDYLFITGEKPVANNV